MYFRLRIGSNISYNGQKHSWREQHQLKIEQERNRARNRERERESKSNKENQLLARNTTNNLCFSTIFILKIVIYYVSLHNSDGEKLIKIFVILEIFDWCCCKSFPFSLGYFSATAAYGKRIGLASALTFLQHFYVMTSLSRATSIT